MQIVFNTKIEIKIDCTKDNTKCPVRITQSYTVSNATNESAAATSLADQICQYVRFIFGNLVEFKIISMEVQK